MNLQDIIYFCLVVQLSAYNFDTFSGHIFREPVGSSRNTYFGYSVAIYVPPSHRLENAVILVGAPRANSSDVDAVEPGTVYRCSTKIGCKEWNLDRSRNGRNGRRQGVNQLRNNAWNGATIAVENSPVPRVMVCAPRWINDIGIRSSQNWMMNGICYKTQVSNEFTFERESDMKLMPLLDIEQQVVSSGGVNVYNYGMGQVGFSIHMVPDKNDVILGSPGIFNWHGTPILMQETNRGSHKSIIPDIKYEQQVRSSDYFGYSVTSGRFFNQNERWFASGAPRSENTFGKVLIFSFDAVVDGDITIKHFLEGEQLGEGFGSALTACDINNDGKDDLIVGSPMWSSDTDEGRFYAFISNSKGNFDMQYINGNFQGGRFGTSVMCLGDIDHDKFADVAVGAPYENGHGVVYIFNGRKQGLSPKYSQKIHGSEFSPSVRGFGFSISEPRDVDGNRYPDIAVGAYLSGHVVLLRTKPVVTLRTHLEYYEHSKIQKNSTWFQVKICSFYNGTFIPARLSSIIVIKIDEEQGRAFIDAHKIDVNIYQIPYTLQREQDMCNVVKINLKNGIQNPMDPIKISVLVEIEDPLCPTCPAMNKEQSQNYDSLSMPFAVDCGSDDICRSDLRISMWTNLVDNYYIIGSNSTPMIIIRVDNFGESAYQAEVHLFIPEPIALARIPPECNEHFRGKNGLEVICDFGNPLKKYKITSLELDVTALHEDVNHTEIRGFVTSQSENTNQNDTAYALKLNFGLDVDIAIVGKAEEDSYSYFQDDKNKPPRSSIKFNHIYEVQTFGTSPIHGTIFTVSIPTYYNNIIVAKIESILGYMNGNKLICTDLNDTSTHGQKTFGEQFPVSLVQKNLPTNNLPLKRTLVVNCLNSAVTCLNLVCQLGDFRNFLSTAKITISIIIHLDNFETAALEGKDIIFFVSEGVVTKTGGSIRTDGFLLDQGSVGTMFLGSPVPEAVALWIIIFSGLLGLLLLIILTLLLIKIGFFNRTEKEKMEALKATTNENQSIDLESISSTEILD